jgi:hypothetical protein
MTLNFKRRPASAATTRRLPTVGLWQALGDAGSPDVARTARTAFLLLWSDITQ